MDLTYWGQSAFQLSDGDTTLLIDPWIAENPHCDRSVDEFDGIDAVLVTHGAHDHVGDAPTIARRNDAPLLCDPATAAVLTRRGFPEELVEGHVWGPKLERDGWSVKVLEARHVSAWPDEGIIGPPNAYLVSIGGETVYHMGDTSIFRDIELFGDLYEPTIALIPVGGAATYYPELYPDEAALVAEWIDADRVVPMHYAPGSDRPAAFVRHCEERGIDADVAVMESGDVLDV